MEEKRTGVYVCWCGSNIAQMVDVEEVSKVLEGLPNVVISKNYKYMCSDPGQDMIINDIKEHNLNRVVVAACSPRIHELTFRKALQNAGLNPYMFEMANIREQVSWVHTDKKEATKKAVSLIAGAINRVNYHESLEKRTVEINSATLIIGGGIAGMSAALELANAGKKVNLIEKSDKLGGIAAKLDLTFPYLDSASQTIDPLIKNVWKNKNISVFLNSEVGDVFGYIGNFNAVVACNKGIETDLIFGNIIVATGLKPFDPTPIQNFGYGRLPNVVTSLEFEGILKNGTIINQEGRVPKYIAIIHCVGSRNEEYHEYCSRNCCMTALKFANQVKSALPESNVFNIYGDMRAFGKGCEELYAASSKRDILFLMYDQKNATPLIRRTSRSNDCDMLIDFREMLSGEQIEVPADLVILMTGMEAREDAKDISHKVGLSLCGNEFFIEKHPKLDPVATTTDGVYVVGSCHAPKDIPDSVSQAKAASARVLATIDQGTVEVEVTTAHIDENICCGCQFCIKVCPYSAISYDESKNISVVNEVICKGCGTCGSACPSGAITSKHFTDKQILSQIEGVMSKLLELQEV